jgi:hypothetical protein
MKRYVKIALMSFLTLGLAGCGGPGKEEFDMLAKQAKLNASERSALEGCYKALSGTKPIVKIGNEEKMFSDVPMDICVCHSRVIAAVFVEGEYTTYGGFQRFYSRPQKGQIPRIGRKDLKKGADNQLAARRIVKDFEKCAVSYVMANKDKPEFKGFLLPAPAPKKKHGEEKQASKG